MRVLAIRHDRDGTMHWKTYAADDPETLSSLIERDLRADLNTVGVSRIEIIPEAQ